jgi:hypothetical protein
MWNDQSGFASNDTDLGHGYFAAINEHKFLEGLFNISLLVG